MDLRPEKRVVGLACLSGLRHRAIGRPNRATRASARHAGGRPCDRVAYGERRRRIINRANQRKRGYVKRRGEVFALICGVGRALGVFGYGRCWCALAAVWCGRRDLGEGRLRFRGGGGVVPGAAAGARHPGLLALRSASGLGLPARWAGLPRQRSTELVRSSGRPGDSCPGFAARLILNVAAGSLSPSSGRKV